MTTTEDRPTEVGLPRAGDQLEESLLSLGEMLLDETAMDEAITNILDVGLRTLGRSPMISLTISQPNDPSQRFRTRDATTETARALDEWQYEHEEGPCLLADETGEVVVVADASRDERFQGFCDRATEAGINSAVCYPMLVSGSSLGSINVFYPEEGPPEPTLVERGEQLARTAAPLLSNWLAHLRVSELANQLQEALEHRGTIERAKGLLMGELGLDEDRAFELLRTQSQHQNVKLRDVAAQLLDDRTKGRQG